MQEIAPALSRFFSPDDLRAIEAAVREVEAASAGEIVPYAVERSGDYAQAWWMAATLGALGAAVAAAIVHALGDAWWPPPALWIGLAAPTGAALGWLAAFALPALRRALVPDEVLEARARLRAASAFLDEEVFATRDRTGVLLFISLFEHRVVILPDRGIAARVAAGEWDGIARATADGIRRGQPGIAVADAIRRCGALLAGVPRRPDDRDELPDRLRTSDR